MLLQKKIFYLYLFFFSLCTLQAQEKSFAIRHFTQEDGLAHNATSAIYQDSRQFIWVGTRVGLTRFDGHEFKSFSKRKNGLNQTDIEEIFEDQHGKLWICYHENQISILDVETEQALSFDEYFPKAPFQNQDIHQIKIGKENKIWIVKNDGSLFQYQLDFELIKQHENLERLILSNETVGVEMIGFDNKHNQALKINSKGEIVDSIFLKTPYVNNLGCYSKEVFWVVTEGYTQLKNNLLVFDWQGNQQMKYLQFEPDSFQAHLRTFTFEDEYDNVQLWQTGLNILLVTDEKGNKIYDFSDLIFPNYSHWFSEKVFKDQLNNIWITSNKGLILISPKENLFQSFLSKENAQKAYYISVRGIERLDDANLFVSTYDGFFKVDKSALKEKKIYVNQPSQVDYGVGTFSIGDTILCGLHAPSFWIFNKQSLDYDLKSFDLRGADFNFFYKDQSNQIWIGSNIGLFNLDLKKMEVNRPLSLSEESDFYNAPINHIIKNKEGLLVGTGLGLYSIDKLGEILSYPEEFRAYQINFIHPVNDHQYWLATRGNGIIFWDKITGAIQQFTKEQGLIDDVIYSITEDEFGYYWLPTNNGLMRFNPKDFSINTFNESDGLANNEFNSFSRFVDKDGQIYLGGVNGITTFHPKDFFDFDKKDIPLKIINSEKLEGDSSSFSNFKWNKEIDFYPTDKAIALEFCLFDYFNSFQSQYSYQLENYDNQWNHLSDNKLVINQLPYGNYTLKVKAQGANGVWSSEELEVPLNFIKPFYLKWYFILFSLLGIIGLVYGIVRWRIIQLKNKNLALENIVAQRTKELKNLNNVKDQFFAIIGHDLRRHVTSFRKVSEKVNFLKRKGRSKELDNYFLRLDKSADNLSSLLDNLLNWALIEKGIFPYHPERIDLREIIEKNIELFRLISETKGIYLNSNIPDELYCYADKNAAMTIIRNVVSNAIKFSKEGGEIVISVDENKIAIQDFGVGMDAGKLDTIFQLNSKTSQQGTHGEKGVGLGLRLCNELMILNKGTISIKSQKGKGTIVFIGFPELSFSNNSILSK